MPRSILRPLAAILFLAATLHLTGCALFAPSASSRIHGIAVDSEGNGISNARVILYHIAARSQSAPGSGTVAETHTDTDGTWKIKRPLTFRPLTSHLPGTESYALMATHPDFAIGWTTVKRDDKRTSFTIQLTEPRSLTVKVRDVDGNPIEGACVWPYSLGNRKAKRPVFRDYLYVPAGPMPVSALSDAEGNAVVTNLPKTRLSFHATKPGYATGLTFTVKRPIRLTPGATLRGTVQTPEGKPVPGAIIELRADWMFLVFLAETDENGHYSFSDIPAKGWDMRPWGKDQVPGNGKYGIKCYSADRACKPGKIEIPCAETVTRDFTLAPACVLAGRVMDITTGEPVSGILVKRYISVPGTQSLDSLELTTDETGHFRFVVPRESEVHLSIEESRENRRHIIDKAWQNQGNYQAFRQVVTESMTDMELRVKLWAVHPLEGQVVDTSGNGTKATIHFHSEQKPFDTDAQGRFTLPTALSDRPFQIFAITRDKKQAGIVFLDASATTATIRLEPTRDYEGEVLDEDGLPAPNLRFYCDLHLNGTSIYRVRTEPRADATGHFRATGLCPKATYYAWWSGDNDTNRNFDHGNATIDLADLKPGAPIRITARTFTNTLMGQVVDAKGNPITTATLSLGFTDLMPQDMRGNFYYSTKADSDGNFAISRLASGGVLVTASAPGYRSHSVMTETDAVDLEIPLHPASEQEPTCTFTLLDENDDPVEGAPITCWLDIYGAKRTTRSITLKTDANGKIAFKQDALPPKTRARPLIGYDIPGYDIFYTTLNSQCDADLFSKLRRSVDYCSGRVVDASGTPVPGAQVRIFGMSVKAPRAHYEHCAIPSALAVSARTDAEGHFQLDRVSTSDWVNINIEAPGYASAGDTHFDPKQKDASTIFRLVRSGTIKGKVVLEDGSAPPEGTVVWASQQDGRKQSHGKAKTRPDGTFSIVDLAPAVYAVSARISRENARKDLLCPEPPTVTLEPERAPQVTVQLVQGVRIAGKVVRHGNKTPHAIGRSLYIRQGKEIRSYGTIEKDGSWELYAVPGEYTLVYHEIQDRGRSDESCKEITVEKGKPQTDIVLEITPK